MSKVEFKKFVQKNPNLVSFVTSGETTWQKLYELFDLYGESSSIWDKYSDKNNSFKDFFSFFKGIDLNSIQKGLTSLDKAIDAFKDILPNNNIKKDNYEPKPKYKFYED